MTPVIPKDKKGENEQKADSTHTHAGTPKQNLLFLRPESVSSSGVAWGSR